MKRSGKNIKLAIQKTGRLTEATLQLLKNMGIEFEMYKDRLFTRSKNFDLEILWLRDDDIPEYVQDQVCDLGIVGENMLKEKGVQVTILERLGFGKCRLSLAVSEKSPIKKIKDLSGKKIATSYVRSLNDFLKKENIKGNVIGIKGSVEIAPMLGIADAVCDLVSTGTTLRTNGLKEIATIFESEALLIQSPKLEKAKRKNIENFLMRLQASIRADSTKYVMLNAPRKALKKIQSIMPSMSSPTVMPLANTEMVAIHSVIPEKILWEFIEKLKRAGGRDILVTPIEQIVI